MLLPIALAFAEPLCPPSAHLSEGTCVAVEEVLSSHDVLVLAEVDGMLLAYHFGGNGESASLVSIDAETGLARALAAPAEIWAQGPFVVWERGGVHRVSRFAEGTLQPAGATPAGGLDAGSYVDGSLWVQQGRSAWASRGKKTLRWRALPELPDGAQLSFDGFAVHEGDATCLRLEGGSWEVSGPFTHPEGFVVDRPTCVPEGLAPPLAADDVRLRRDHFGLYAQSSEDAHRWLDGAWVPIEGPTYGLTVSATRNQETVRPFEMDFDMRRSWFQARDGDLQVSVGGRGDTLWARRETRGEGPNLPVIRKDGAYDSVPTIVLHGDEVLVCPESCFVWGLGEEAWTELGPPPVTPMAVGTVGGRWQVLGQPAGGRMQLATWNGGAWQVSNVPFYLPEAIASNLADGSWMVVGTSARHQDAWRYDGAEWASVASPPFNGIKALAPLTDGRMAAGGFSGAALWDPVEDRWQRIAAEGEVASLDGIDLWLEIRYDEWARLRPMIQPMLPELPDADRDADRARCLARPGCDVSAFAP